MQFKKHWLNMFVNKNLIIALLLATNLSAESSWSDSFGSVWEKTKEVSGEVLDTTLQKGQEFSKDTMDLVNKLNLGDDDCTTNEEAQKEHLSNIWDDFLKKSTDGLKKLNKIEDAPEPKFLSFGDDKVSLREDFNSILNDIMLLLSEDSKTYACLIKIEKLKKGIIEETQNIREYKESRITAPSEHSIKTTKSGYSEKIANAKETIAFYSAKIEEIKKVLLNNLNLIGLSLNMSQLEVLLSRVDSNDIVKMSIVFDTSKSITKELAKLLSESGEDIEVSRRYYGMNLILSEMVVYAQKSYVSQLENVYIPKLKAIIAEVKDVERESKRLLNNTNDKAKREIYEANIKSLSLTIETAKIYINNLELQKDKVRKAYVVAKENLALTQNTYKTVAVSSKLLSLIKSTQKSFNHLMSMQLPEIVPFKNLQMQKEYEKLTSKISK